MQKIMMLSLGMLVFAGLAFSGGVLTFKVHEKVLSNGFKILVVPVDSPGVAAYYTVVRAGSRNEPEPGRSGYAHFFEHIMFRGTEKYPEQKYNEVLKRMGADSNAFTSDDYTCYHMVGPAAKLEVMFDIESDRFQNLNYSEKDFKTEAGAILGEYRKSHSNPFLTIFEKLDDTAYTAHTYKHTTMGFLKDIQDMPNGYDYSREFFRRYYKPDNCVLIVTGDVDPEAVFAMAQKYYGAWSGRSDPAPITSEPPQTETKSAHVDWELPTLPYLVVAYHGPAFDAKSRENAALDVVSQLLFSESAPFYQDLVVQKQWVDWVEGSWEFHRDPGLYLVLARVAKPEKAGEIQSMIVKALEELKTAPISEKRLNDIKSNLKYSFLSRLNTADRVAGSVAYYVNLTGSWQAIDELYATYDSLTPADIQNAAGRVFTESNRTVVTLSRKEK
jgi:zinc protease